MDKSEKVSNGSNSIFGNPQDIGRKQHKGIGRLFHKPE